MTLEEMAYRAAARATMAAAEAITSYADGTFKREDDITAGFIQAIKTKFDGRRSGSIRWSASVLNRGPGSANEEGRVGADMLVHVMLNTPTYQYSKGVLIQAKRKDFGARLTTVEHGELVGQCGHMLAISPAAFVANYTKQEMRFSAATLIAGTQERDLSRACIWSAHRFFLELFRCPIGDPRITSAKFEHLQGVRIVGQGELEAAATSD